MTRSRFAVLFVLLFALTAFAQGSNPQSASTTVPASISINESLSIALSAGGPAFVIPPTQNGLSNVITFQTTYNLIGTNHAGGIQYVTWFNATNALTGNFTVTSGNLSTQVNGGIFVPCTGASVQGSMASATCSTWSTKTQANLNTTPSGTENNTVAIQYTGTTLTNAGTASGTFNIEVYSL